MDRIRTTSDLCRIWHPVVVGIDEMPHRPTPGETVQLRELLDNLADAAVGTPYLMFSRSGGPGVTASDREWAGVIRELQRGLGVDRPVLRGVGTSVVPLSK